MSFPRRVSSKAGHRRNLPVSAPRSFITIPDDPKARPGRGVGAQQEVEDAAGLPLGDQGVLLGGLLDGADDDGAVVGAQVGLDEGLEPRDGGQHGAPGGGALPERVEGVAVALLRTAALRRAQVQTRPVVLGAHTAPRGRVVAGLVVDVAEVAAGVG